MDARPLVKLNFHQEHIAIQQLLQLDSFLEDFVNVLLEKEGGCKIVLVSHYVLNDQLYRFYLIVFYGVVKGRPVEVLGLLEVPV